MYANNVKTLYCRFPSMRHSLLFCACCYCVAPVIFITFVAVLNYWILNYLAHIFLSGNNLRVQVGNFIGDFVKGSKLDDYPDSIRKGIRLHRLIDSYTDSHEVVVGAKAFIRPAFGRYSGIVLDMYFDYFLAVNIHRYAGHSLRFYATRFYLAALLNYAYLPIRVRSFIFHFISTNRLMQYRTLEGLRFSLEIMSRRKVPAIDPGKTISFLEENKGEIERRFLQFFPDLMAFVERTHL